MLLSSSAMVPGHVLSQEKFRNLIRPPFPPGRSSTLTDNEGQSCFLIFGKSGRPPTFPARGFGLKPFAEQIGECFFELSSFANCAKLDFADEVIGEFKSCLHAPIL